MIGIVVALIWFCAFQSCYIGRTVIYNFADIKDYKKFPARTIETDRPPFVFPNASHQRPPKIFAFGHTEISFEEFLKRNETVAFLIIKNDSIYYENYFFGYSRESIIPSFSMAKSVLSILIGIAIEDGYIDSISDPVAKYVPGMEDKKFRKVSLENVLNMTSGIAFNEAYLSPFSDVAPFYYGKNLTKRTKKLKIESKPGENFEYNSGNAQILGLVLNNALPPGTSISEYLEKKLWKPLGMEYNATWSLDEEGGIEKTFCCLNARAIDFAKIGRLYLKGGKWKGAQIVPQEWVENSTKIDTSNGDAWYYQNLWWLPSANGDFMAKGFLGEFIYVNPKEDLIMVRLGKDYGSVRWMGWFPMVATNY